MKLQEMLPFSCRKVYKDLPAAHRQHSHDGHCAWIHGHNWSFELTFACKCLDDNRFVIDFGKLKFIKEWLDDVFDHTLLINEDDPWLEKIRSFGHPHLLKMVVVPNCGAEALAQYVLDNVNLLLQKHAHTEYFQRGVTVVTVTCFEDSKNSATYQKTIG